MAGRTRNTLSPWTLAVISVAGFVLAIFAAPLRAADPTEIAIQQLRPKNLGKLELKLRPSFAAIRSDAPFSIELELESTFPEIIEGELELTFVDDTETRLKMRTGPLAVPHGQKSFRISVPAMAANLERANFVVRARFHGPRGPLDLGTHDLMVPVKGQRQFLMAVAGFGDLTISQFTRRLSLDTFRPPEAQRSLLLTLPVEIDLHVLPWEPVGLYSFDVLVAAGEYFSRLSARQLGSIADWVESGGGLVVVPTGVLTPAHTAFLERLAGRDAKAPRFVTDQFGRLPPRKPGDKNWLEAYRYGYGRALIVQSMPPVGPAGSLMGVDAAAWTRAVCFLWNVRPDQTAAILKNGNWKAIAPPTNDEMLNKSKSQYLQSRWNVKQRPVIQSNYSEYDDLLPLHPEKLAQADALRALLFPAEVRVVPFRVVAAILALFLFAIAPADYFLLGLLRCRKFTWFVFPAFCMLFTVATVCVAQYYTGKIDHRSALVIVDVGEKGKPLRTTRIEHIITAGTRPISTDVKQGVFALTDVQPLKSDVSAQRPNAARARDLVVPTANDVLDYAGSLPSTYTVTRLSRQWSPSMDRVTTTVALDAVPPIPWSELDSIDASSEQGRTAIRTRLRQSVPDADILFLPASAGIADRQAGPTALRSGRFQNWPIVVAALSQRSDRRLFSIISRISPNGADNLEDLSVLDAAEPNTILLHVAVERGDDLLVFRRLLQSNRRFNLN